MILENVPYTYKKYPSVSEFLDKYILGKKNPTKNWKSLYLICFTVFDAARHVSFSQLITHSNVAPLLPIKLNKRLYLQYRGKTKLRKTDNNKIQDKERR